jgi:hypothetical protein
MVIAAEQDKVTVRQQGRRNRLGTTDEYCGIWRRGNLGWQLAARFPLTAEGWQEATDTFALWEPRGPYARDMESEASRIDRNYNEILQELRVAEAGVQILFAFLLALAFTSRFEQVTSFERGIYFASLLLSAMASGLLMAPAALHRITFRRGAKDVLVDVASKMALAGITALGIAMSGSVLLVSDVLFGGVASVVATAMIVLWLGSLWYLLPLRIRVLTKKSPWMWEHKLLIEEEGGLELDFFDEEPDFEVEHADSEF